MKEQTILRNNMNSEPTKAATLSDLSTTEVSAALATLAAAAVQPDERVERVLAKSKAVCLVGGIEDPKQQQLVRQLVLNNDENLQFAVEAAGSDAGDALKKYISICSSPAAKDSENMPKLVEKWKSAIKRYKTNRTDVPKTKDVLNPPNEKSAASCRGTKRQRTESKACDQVGGQASDGTTSKLMGLTKTIVDESTKRSKFREDDTEQNEKLARLAALAGQTLQQQQQQQQQKDKTQEGINSLFDEARWNKYIVDSFQQGLAELRQENSLLGKGSQLGHQNFTHQDLLLQKHLLEQQLTHQFGQQGLQGNLQQSLSMLNGLSANPLLSNQVLLQSLQQQQQQQQSIMSNMAAILAAANTTKPSTSSNRETSESKKSAESKRERSASDHANVETKSEKLSLEESESATTMFPSTNPFSTANGFPDAAAAAVAAGMGTHDMQQIAAIWAAQEVAMLQNQASTPQSSFPNATGLPSNAGMLNGVDPKYLQAAANLLSAQGDHVQFYSPAIHSLVVAGNQTIASLAAAFRSTNARGKPDLTGSFGLPTETADSAAPATSMTRALNQGARNSGARSSISSVSNGTSKSKDSDREQLKQARLDARREKKSKRERQRRLMLNGLYDKLGSLLFENGEHETKDRASILNETIRYLHQGCGLKLPSNTTLAELAKGTVIDDSIGEYCVTPNCANIAVKNRDFCVAHGGKDQKPSTLTPEQKLQRRRGKKSLREKQRRHNVNVLSERVGEMLMVTEVKDKTTVLNVVIEYLKAHPPHKSTPKDKNSDANVSDEANNVSEQSTDEPSEACREPQTEKSSSDPSSIATTQSNGKAKSEVSGLPEGLLHIANLAQQEMERNVNRSGST